MDIFNASFRVMASGILNYPRLEEIINNINRSTKDAFYCDPGASKHEADVCPGWINDTSRRINEELLLELFRAVNAEGWALSGKWTEDADGEFFRCELRQDGTIRRVLCSFLLEMSVPEIIDSAREAGSNTSLEEYCIVPADPNAPEARKYQMAFTKEDAGTLQVLVRPAPSEAEVLARNTDYKAYRRKDQPKCFAGAGVQYHEDLLTAKYTGVFRMRLDFQYMHGTASELTALCLSFAYSACVYRIATGNLMAKALVDAIGQEGLSPSDFGELSGIAEGKY